MSKAKRFEDLEIWQLARLQCSEVEKTLVETLYKRNQRLKDQLQGSSGSVMDNIAEGFEKENTKEFINFLFHAKASAGEMRSQLIRVVDLGYCESEKVKPLIERAESLSRKMWTFITYLKTSGYKGTRHVSEPQEEYLTMEEFNNLEY